MSFKRLGDPRRQEAIVPFLQAADELNGHLVVFAVHKTLRLIPCKKKDVDKGRQAFGLNAKWNPRAFEDAFFKTHLFSLLVSQWSKQHTDVTWISDQDEFVANEQRLDDAQIMAAKISSLYSPHPLGILAMNTTSVDGVGREFEDFVAIPDLAAGMVSNLSTRLAKTETWSSISANKFLPGDALKAKSNLLLDWFWFDSAELRRTCIVIDKCGGQPRVFKLDHMNDVG